MLSACWLIGAYFLAVSSHKRGRLNTSVYGKSWYGGGGGGRKGANISREKGGWCVGRREIKREGRRGNGGGKGRTKEGEGLRVKG